MVERFHCTLPEEQMPRRGFHFLLAAAERVCFVRGARPLAAASCPAGPTCAGSAPSPPRAPVLPRAQPPRLGCAQPVGPVRLRNGAQTRGPLRSIQRMPPAQPGEATEPSIERDPITAPLKSQSRMVSVRHQVAARVGSLTKIDKNFPVIGTRRKNMHFGTRAQVFHKIQRRR